MRWRVYLGYAAVAGVLAAAVGVVRGQGPLLGFVLGLAGYVLADRVFARYHTGTWTGTTADLEEPSDTDRARLTIGDMIYYGATLVFVAPLLVVFLNGLDNNAGQLGVGEAYLFQLLAPVFILTLLAVIWFTAVVGVPRS